MEDNNKPDWLIALEAQSWQAELIASGLAIYGSISLGTYIDDLAQWVVPNFSDHTLGVLYFAFLYVYTAHALLVISFITHLGLRILWAGILGLSSVYPKGINLDSVAYSDSFKRQLKKDFPNLSEYSLSLDRLCSLIFSVLCALVIIIASITFWLIAYLVISEILVRFMPYTTIDKIGFVLVIILFIFSMVGGIFTQTKLKNSKFADKYGYLFTMTFGKIIYLFGFKSFNYITQTIRTNVTNKSFFFGMFGLLIVSMLGAFPRFVNYVPYFQEQIWVDYNEHPSQVSSEHYLDAFQTRRILEPVIQSQNITDNYLDLFIPKYEREEEQRIALCGEYDWDDDLSSFENRNKRDVFRSNCAQKYYQLELDGVPINNIELMQKYHPHQEELGYQAYLPIDSLDRGRHVLTIKSIYTSSYNDISYSRSIPFYKVN